jgi:ribose transport system permease protein
MNHGLRRVLANRQALYILGANVLLAFVLVLVTPAFGTGYNAYVLLKATSISVVVGLAQLVVLSVGQFNLSVGGLAGLVTAGVAVAAKAGAPLPVIILIALAVGVLGGLLNGLLVAKTGLSGFVLTLATGGVFTGLNYGITQGAPTSPISKDLEQFGVGQVLFVPNLFWLALIVAAAIAAFYRWAPAGRAWLATGGNAEAAELSGISRNTAVTSAYILSGVLSAVAALMVVSNIKSAQPETGNTWLILSFTVPIIAGALLNGGNAPVITSVLAALLVTMIDNGLTLVNVDAYWVTLLQGVLIFLAVIITRARVRQRARWGVSALVPAPRQRATTGSSA